MTFEMDKRLALLAAMYLISFGYYRLSEQKAIYGVYIKGGMLTDEVFKNSR